MERLFRYTFSSLRSRWYVMTDNPIHSKKRNPPSTVTNDRSSTWKKLPSSSGLGDSASGKPRGGLGKELRKANHWGDGAPSLDVDIRNSLILPGCESLSVLHD